MEAPTVKPTTNTDFTIHMDRSIYNNPQQL